MRLIISNAEGHILSIPYDTSEEKLLFSLHSADIMEFARDGKGKLDFIMLDDNRYLMHKGVVLVRRNAGKRALEVNYIY